VEKVRRRVEILMMGGLSLRLHQAEDEVNRGGSVHGNGERLYKLISWLISRY